MSVTLIDKLYVMPERTEFRPAHCELALEVVGDHFTARPNDANSFNIYRNGSSQMMYLTYAELEEFAEVLKLALRMRGRTGGPIE